MRHAQRSITHARSRWAFIRALLIGLAIMLAPAPALAYPSVLVPDRGAYVGSWVAPRSGETGQEPIRRVEHAMGRRFAIDHRYYRWNQALPTKYDKASSRAGRLPFISWKPMRTDGSIIPWSYIADGLHDEWITTQARRFKRFGAPAYLTFHHEPEDDASFGTPAEFASAFRHVVDIFRQHRVHNVAFVWTMMSWTFAPGSGRDPMDWYPGNAYVDIVGTDGYNWYPLRDGARWDSFRDVMAPTMAFAKDIGKPVFVVEYGVLEDPDDPDHKANWLREVAETVRDWPRLKGLIYFDEIKDGWPWNTDSSPQALDGYSDMAHARWLSVMPRLR